jgi:hypothetical protein
VLSSTVPSQRCRYRLRKRSDCDAAGRRPPQVGRRTLGVAGIAVVGGVLGLWFKGATVALYLRVVPAVVDTGSA